MTRILRIMSITGNPGTPRRPVAATCSGFTLIEILVAVTILSIGIVAVLEAFSVSLDALHRSRDVVRASDAIRTQLAEAEMSAMVGQKMDPVSRGSESAPDGAMIWQRTVVPVPDSAISELPDLVGEIELHRVSVSAWRDTGGREYRATTCVIPWPQEKETP